MKTKGPHAPRGAGPTERVDRATAATGVDPTGEVVKADAAAPTTPTQAAAGSAPVDAVANVAAQLRAGAITVERAVELLIEDAVQRQLGPTLANSRELESTLRETLRNYAENDPVLSTRIRRLNRK